MTTFLRLLADKDKASNLRTACSAVRAGVSEARIFDVAPGAFQSVPGVPFSYWVSEDIRQTFKRFPAFEGGLRSVRQGLATADDFRFVRVWWEVQSVGLCWFGLAKGGAYSRFYSDTPTVVNWASSGKELNSFSGSVIRNPDFYCRPGISWPLRGIKFSAQAISKGCVFSVAGKMAFAPEHELEAWLAIFNTHAFDYLIRLFAGKVGGVQYEVGLIGGIPISPMSTELSFRLSELARNGWHLKRKLASTDERSHAFLLPSLLRARLDDYDVPTIEAELVHIQAEIDDIAFELYGFSDADRASALGSADAEVATDEPSDFDDGDEYDAVDDAPSTDGLLSWAVGVAFGRFDWRLASGERTSLPEPEPFDPLPAKSPGMLPDGVTPFHQHAGILVDDLGHSQDLARLVEQVLETVDAPVADDVRRWVQKDFFAFHLKRYSKSRRKAPIYWPLATASGSYTLWLYYPCLNDQTLFTAVNDFVDPKLKDVRKELQDLRDKGAGRSQQDEKRLEALVSLEHELADLRDSLLEIAPNYRPNHDDGVQITASPLWKLFRHKPWQKVLKDTWAKLEKGDYDWAHLAMNYWPERVREKCISDKSLAIAHALEELHVEPEAVSKGARGRKKGG